MLIIKIILQSLRQIHAHMIIALFTFIIVLALPTNVHALSYLNVSHNTPELSGQTGNTSRHRIVRVGLYENKPKIYKSKSGQPSGIFVELLNAIAKKENWKLDYVQCRWTECLDALSAGQIDLMPDVALSPERARKMDFHQEMVIESWSQLYANKNSSVRDITELNGRRVALLRGSIQQSTLKQMIKGFGYDVSFVEAASYKDAFALTAKGSADVVVTNHFFGNYYYRQYGLVRTSIVFNPVSLYFATAKGKNPDLLEGIDRNLRNMKSTAGSAFYTTLAHWMERPPKTVVPRYLVWIISGIVVFLILAFVVILLLRRLVITRTNHLVDANEKLHESEEKFRKLFQNHTAVKLIIDPESGNIVEVNESAEKFYGWSADQLRQKRIQDINVPLPNQVNSKIDYLGSYSKSRHKRADGSARDVEVFTSRINIKGKMLDHLIIHDVTEFRKLEEQYRQSQKMESVGRLAGGVAHDYNNMIGVILGYTEISLASVDSQDPLHEYLTEILNAANRSSDITRQLLAFARKQTVTPKIIDINDITEGMLKMLRPLIGEDIELAWLPGSNLKTIKIDPSQLEQILVNLCVNARDAIAGVGKIYIETANRILDDDYCAEHYGFVPGEYVTLVISDNGSGMDKDTLENIFEPFYTTKDENKGTGLGLATVYGIVKQNNGFINVYSEPGKGTTFRIYLPCHLGEDEKTIVKAVSEIPKGGKETVLLVEDDAAIRQMTQMMLERLGYRVLFAETANEALRVARENLGDIQLLFTDVIMPEMNGHELATELLNINPKLKVLFMSGYTADVIAQRGMLEEGVQFIQKPFSMRDLAVKLREILDQE